MLTQLVVSSSNPKNPLGKALEGFSKGGNTSLSQAAFDLLEKIKHDAG